MTVKYLLDIHGSQLDTGNYSSVQHKVMQLGDDFKSVWLIDISFLFYYLNLTSVKSHLSVFMYAFFISAAIILV